MLSKEHLNALQTVGYREWFAHFNGQCSETEAIERIKVHTRQFAKRQMTWFKRMENIHWVNAFDTKAIENIVEEACRIRSWTLHRPFSAID
jgi:tRNA dimethylallyltransferase